MRILGISGSPATRGSHYLLEQALGAASNKGAETEIINVTDYDLKVCKGCGHCLKKKECILDDDLEEIGEKMLQAEGIIIASPSYFGSIPAALKNLMDRSRYLKMDDHALKNKFLGVVSTSGLKHGGAQSVIESIHRYGLLHAMLIISPAGQPQTEANMVIATSEKDDGWRKIKDDKKAVNLAKNLGKRMATIKGKLFN